MKIILPPQVFLLVRLQLANALHRENPFDPFDTFGGRQALNRAYGEADSAAGG
jgi:hypothetical protein